MKVKELITQLLECRMEAEVFIFVDKDNAHARCHKVHIGDNTGYRETNTFDVVIESVDDLEFRTE